MTALQDSRKEQNDQFHVFSEKVDRRLSAIQRVEYRKYREDQYDP